MPPPALPEESVQETTPALMEDILEQIFLHLPPDEPACLVRASLASKIWFALLTGPRFRSRYREHHDAPPMLGILKSTPWGCTPPKEGDPATVPPFVSTTGFRARVPDDGWGHRNYTAWDCRHGRVLVGENNELLEGPKKLAVWDPMTGRRRELQEPEVVCSYGLCAAAVLCAVSGCDHLACHEGPFQVVFFSLHDDGGDDFVARVCVSLETRDCSKPCSDFHRTELSGPCPGVSVRGDVYIIPRPPVLVNNALHFQLDQEGGYEEILKYDLSSNCLSLIYAPKAGANKAGVSILMAMEDEKGEIL
ncbi:hypothetical protein ACQ4PT_026136 [Festuca glaucescens]